MVIKRKLTPFFRQLRRDEITTVCMYCKRKQTGPDLWEEATQAKHTWVSHGTCPPCYHQVLPALLEEIDLETSPHVTCITDWRQEEALV